MMADTLTKREGARNFRVGLFANELNTLLTRLTPAEFFAFHKFRCEYVFCGAVGIADDDHAVVQLLGCKQWPDLKAKLITIGVIRTEAGLLRDPDLDASIERQTATKLRQSAAANKRWAAAKIGGAA